MKATFSTTQQVDFLITLRTRVENYFKSNNISKTANQEMVFKTILLSSVFIILYLTIIFHLFQSGIVNLLLCMLLGLFVALLGFNVGHDAVHGSYSKNPRVNKFLGYSFDLLGASSYMWNIAHNIVHHTYTNVPEHDDDIEPVFLIRLNPKKKRLWIHRFQHWYATFFYALTSLSWVIQKDFKQLFSKQIGKSYTKKEYPVKNIVYLFIGKVVYFFLFFVLPLIVLPFSWWQIVIGFVSLHIIEGITLAIVFQLAHVVEGPSFPEPNENGQLETNWAVHQLYTTANFARNSKLATFLFGGLNFQIEHHLFPKVCHIHYPKLSEIVKQTATEFGLPYHENKTMWLAIKSHYRILKKLGKEDNILLSY